MSLHPDPATFYAASTPNAGHRILAAAFVASPGTALLTLTLWSLSGPHMSAASLALCAAFIFAGLYPFCLSVQQWRGAAIELRMKQGRFATLLASYVLYTLALPGFGFVTGQLSGPAPIVSAALVTTVIGWATWTAIRTAPSSRRSG